MAEKEKKLSYSSIVKSKSFMDVTLGDSENPWSNVDKLEGFGVETVKEYRKTVKACRFFYKRDTLASSVINKTIEIAINELNISRNSLSENQFKLFEYLKEDIGEFAETVALEYLLSGLVIPEIEFQPVTRILLKEIGIKRYKNLSIPSHMWVRNPNKIKIKRPPIGSGESYFVEIDSELITFVTNKGQYADGEQDKELYQEILKLYPEFIAAIRRGETSIKLDNPYVLKRRPVLDSPYPVPYLLPALEAMKHKRNIRRMDYALASRAIGAIQHFKLGTDEFPLLEGDEEEIDNMKNQMFWRNAADAYQDRIFQFFTNHTVSIEWIIPPLDALLDAQKYDEINSSILQALGFPKILITGEVQRTGTTDADIAILSPIKSMEYLRRKVIRIIKNIFSKISSENGFNEIPEVEFSPMNLVGFKDYVAGVNKLYESGNMSRTDYARTFGVNFSDSMSKLSEDNKMIEQFGLTEFAPLPNSRVPLNTESTKNNKKQMKS